MGSMRFDDKFVFGLVEEDKLVKSLGCSPYYQKIGSGAELHVQIGGKR